MTRIYRYISNHPEYNRDLPTESIWLPHDYPKHVYEYEVNFDAENNREPRHKVGKERNFEEYVCFPNTEREYVRMRFEELEDVLYYECEDLEEFLLENPDMEIVSHRGYIFERTWMD